MCNKTQAQHAFFPTFHSVIDSYALLLTQICVSTLVLHLQCTCCRKFLLDHMITRFISKSLLKNGKSQEAGLYVQRH